MNQLYRVLLVTKSTGGVATYIRNFVHGMDRSKFTFTVACLSEYGREFANELSSIPGVQAFNIDMNRYRIDPLSDSKVLFQLVKQIRKGKYDLIHAHASKPGYLSRFAAIGTGIPVLYSPHGFSFHVGSGRAKAWFYASLERLAVPFTRLIITVSDGERQLARQYKVGPESLFVVIHTGIDPVPFRCSTENSYFKESLEIPIMAPLVGAVGRLNSQKSPLDFVYVAAIIHQRCPDVHFVWIGTGPLESKTRRLSQTLGLDSVFHFVGQRQDIPSLLKTFNCMVLTSRWEGFPLVALEALAANVPVVATDISGTQEVIESGVNGLLAPVGDYSALANCVLDILNNPRMANEFRQAGSKRIDEEFTTYEMYNHIESVYLNVLSQSNKKAVLDYARDTS